MAVFKFQLQTVLRQRLAVEKQRQVALSLIEHERLGLEREIRACHETASRERRGLSEGLSEMSTATAGSIHLRGVRFQAARVMHLNMRARQAAVKLAGVHARREASRQQLAQATIARKAMETLRDRRYEAWREEQNRKEAAAMDEMMITRAGRRASNHGTDSMMLETES